METTLKNILKACTTKTLAVVLDAVLGAAPDAVPDAEAADWEGVSTSLPEANSL